MKRKRQRIAHIFAIILLFSATANASVGRPRADLPRSLYGGGGRGVWAGDEIVLYDGARGTAPDAQGWVYQSLYGVARRAHQGAATILDTTGAKRVLAGYAASAAGAASGGAPVPALDRWRGYRVIFTVRVEQEDHAGSDDNGDGHDDRAGLSAIVLSSDGRGVELGFWKNRIWAQEGGTGSALFTQAEGAAFDTTAGLVAYTLAVRGNTYTLLAGGEPILSGELRDYTAFDGTPDPYVTPNFLFFGDNTSRAHARFRLAYVAVMFEKQAPAPPSRQVFIPLVKLG